MENWDQPQRRKQLRLVCRAVVLALALCQIWTTRYVIDPDGTAYVDVARAWLQGDWIHALNSYWSPLYVWLFSFAFAIFSPSAHWQIPLIHLIALGGFVAAFAAWEWLTSEWELWQGVSKNPMLTDVAGYSVFAWAGLRLIGLGWFNSADILVMAILIAIAALLVRVRRGASKNTDFLLLGILLGLGFLAKTAFAAVIPIFLLALTVLLRSWADRRVLVTALTTFTLVAPFIAAISIANDHFTMGDSGRLNYSWHVTGMSVEGYKDSAFPPDSGILHPTTVLMQNPRVLSFERHLVGTFPIHSDVSWWCAGYPARFDPVRQFRILTSNIKYSIVIFGRCPVLYLVLVCLVFGAPRMFKYFQQAWFLWLPSLIFAMTYCFVYSDARYLAGSYAIIGFSLIGAVWKVNLPRTVMLGCLFAIPFLSLLLFGSSFRVMVRQFAGDITGRRAPLEFFNFEIAEAMQQRGMRPGDRVAIVGASLTAAHVGLERAQIVAIVPEQVTQDDVLGGRRPMDFSFGKTDVFWRSSPQTRARVLGAFRGAGAKWVFADCVPPWADKTGWEVAGGAQVFRPGDLPFVYVQKLI